MSIHLRIDRLIVDPALLAGVTPRQFQKALQAELAMHLAGPDAHESLKALGNVPALPTTTAGHVGKPLAIGVGASLAGAMGISRSPRRG
ncbi:hypothetical protein [Pinirhizobacter sp.]|jgi:hypothetical protein|uniref:hypothetical protein n=1 Tax=Pinirhizobacter sp. TaxID=2950432 RepID=UPI002F42F289